MWKQLLLMYLLATVSVMVDLRQNLIFILFHLVTTARSHWKPNIITEQNFSQLIQKFHNPYEDKKPLNDFF